jgi:hypothetical protein
MKELMTRSRTAVVRTFVPEDRQHGWLVAMRARVPLILLGVLGLVVHAFAPHVITLDAGELSLYAIVSVLCLVPGLESFSLPGGVGGKFIASAGRLTDQMRMQQQAQLAAAPTEEVGSQIGDGVGSAEEAAPSLAGSSDALAGVRDLAAVAPEQGLDAVRVELMRTLRGLCEQLAKLGVLGAIPLSDYEVVRLLARLLAISPTAAQAAYAVLGATEPASRPRRVSTRDVDTLVGAVDALQRQLDPSANPAGIFELAVGCKLRLITSARVVKRSAAGWDYEVGPVIVEAKYITPGTNTIRVLADLKQRFEADPRRPQRMVVVVNDEASRGSLRSSRILVKRLSELTPADLQPPPNTITRP